MRQVNYKPNIFDIVSTILVFSSIFFNQIDFFLLIALFTSMNFQYNRFQNLKLLKFYRTIYRALPKEFVSCQQN
jgi:hypothetical protein